MGAGDDLLETEVSLGHSASIDMGAGNDMFFAENMAVALTGGASGEFINMGSGGDTLVSRTTWNLTGEMIEGLAGAKGVEALGISGDEQTLTVDGDKLATFVNGHSELGSLFNLYRILEEGNVVVTKAQQGTAIDVVAADQQGDNVKTMSGTITWASGQDNKATIRLQTIDDDDNHGGDATYMNLNLVGNSARDITVFSQYFGGELFSDIVNTGVMNKLEVTNNDSGTSPSPMKITIKGENSAFDRDLLLTLNDSTPDAEIFVDASFKKDFTFKAGNLDAFLGGTEGSSTNITIDLGEEERGADILDLRTQNGDFGAIRITGANMIVKNFDPVTVDKIILSNESFNAGNTVIATADGGVGPVDDFGTMVANAEHTLADRKKLYVGAIEGEDATYLFHDEDGNGTFTEVVKLEGFVVTSMDGLGFLMPGA